MILAEPLNDVPFIVREVCKVVAVVAFPLREPVSVPDSPPLNVALPPKVLVELMLSLYDIISLQYNVEKDLKDKL